MSDKPVMPVFELADLGEDEVEELNKKAAARIEPGLYAFEITEATFDGPTKKDPTWFKLNVKLAVANGVIFDTLLVPTKAYTYGENQQKYPLHRLKEFFAGIGESDDLAQLKKTIPKVLGKDGSKIVGRKGEVRVDFRDNRLEKVGDEIKVLDKKGVPMVDGDNNELSFPDWDAAKAYCKEHEIFTFGFVKVAEYTAKNATVKKDDVPF